MSSSIFTKWFQGRVKKQHKADKNAQTFILEPIYTPSGLVDGGDDSDSIDIPAIDDLENLSKTTEDTGSIDNTEAENIEVEDSEVEDTREIDDTSDDLSDDASDSVEATHDASDLSDEDIGEEISFIDDLSDEDTSDDISATEEIPEVIEDETPEEPTTATTTPEDDTVDDTVEAAEDDTSEETVAEDDTTEESIAEADDTSNDDSLGETASEETVAETDEELSDDETSEETVAESEDLDEADEALLDEPPKFELPAFDSGVFTVGESGEVGIDFLYDGGKYQGELGIFSLSGLDALEFEAVEDFIAEAAQRVASNSELGYIIISDPSEGARFNGSLEGGKDWNSGDYRGVKTFTMKAGDKFAVMLVPNARVSEVVNNPAVGGAKQPLFSLSTANPEDEFHIGQIADVTGDGNTFVMEDIRADGKSDRDYNDLIFQVRGATGSTPTVDSLIDEGNDWRETELGQDLVNYAKGEEPISETPEEPIGETPEIPEEPIEEPPEEPIEEPPEEPIEEPPEEPIGETPKPPEEPIGEPPEEPIGETPEPPEEPIGEPPEEPIGETPEIPEEPIGETPEIPEEPIGEPPEEPIGETPETPEEPIDETPEIPEEPIGETPEIPEEPIGEPPEEPIGETPETPEEPIGETPETPEEPDNTQPDPNVVEFTPEMGFLEKPIEVSEGIWFFGGKSPDELDLKTSFSNVAAADTTNTDRLWEGGDLGLNLDGSDVTVGVWDGGKIRGTHQELAGRVSYGDSSSYNNHATHVAGTIGATGVKSEAHGMANQVSIQSFDWNNDFQEMRDAAKNGLSLSNHSYGAIRGWTKGKFTWTGFEDVYIDTWMGDRGRFSEDQGFGKYSGTSHSLDDVLYDNPYLLSVWAAGNDRDDRFLNVAKDNTYVAYFSQNPGISGWTGAGWYRVDNSGVTFAPNPDGSSGGYDTLSNAQTAKNTLVVGAIHDITTDPYTKSDASISNFSAFGLTDDGRLKVDVVANGVGVLSTVADSDSSYAIYDGTSMAAPNVTGTAALLTEHYKNLYGDIPLGATLKAILIHTAAEAGNVGPDYIYGWGVVDAAAAVNFIDTAKQQTSSRLIEDTYRGSTQTHTVTSDGSEPLKATIVWTDPAGVTHGNGLDETTRALVNDLDLWIVDPNGNKHRPWTLDPNNPSAAAQRNKRNELDNVEQVLIDNPIPGTYTVHVGNTGALTNGQQDFSLLVSGVGEPEPVKSKISVSVKDASAGERKASETQNPAVFTLTREGDLSKAETVSYSLGGSADSSDYGYLSGLATFEPGQASIDIKVMPIDDSRYEGNETITLSLNGSSDYELGTVTTGQATIHDNDPPPISQISVELTNGIARETEYWQTSQPAIFTVKRSGGDNSKAENVYYTVSGSADNGIDYSVVSGVVTIPAGSDRTTVKIQPINDSKYEGTETVSLQVTANPNYKLGATTNGTASIEDNDFPPSVITVTTEDSVANESGNPAQFRINRSGGDNSKAETVYYSLTGTAENGEDYTYLSGVATILAGMTSTVVTLNPLDDSTYEGTETVTFQVTNNSNYNLGTTTRGEAIIEDNDSPPPVVTIGGNSRAPYLFQEAYNRINGSIEGITPVDNAYRWGNGWTQEFRDRNGNEMLLMLEDGATKAFWMKGVNLQEYKYMGGPVGRTINGWYANLGYPRSDENTFTHDGKYAVWQAFAAEDGKARIHYLYGVGSVATWGQIGRKYTDIGGATHWLGMPTSREYNYNSDTVYSDFENGKIAYQRSTGRLEVLRPGELPSWLMPVTTPTPVKSTAFGVSWTGELTRINLETGVSESLGSTGFSNLNSLTSDGQGKLLTIANVDSAVGEIIQIDPSDGTSRVVSTFNNNFGGVKASIRGLTRAADGSLYAIHDTSGGSIGDDALFRINPQTGTASEITILDRSSLQSLAMAPSGKLYSIDMRDGALIEIDPNTGTSKTIGAKGGFLNVQGLAFDDNGVLYATGQPNSYTVDLQTGALTPVPELGTFRGLAFISEGQLTSAPGTSNATTLYDITFDESSQALGQQPIANDSSNTISRVVFGDPTVEQSSGRLGNRPLVFTDDQSGYDQVQLDVRAGFERYSLSFDFDPVWLNGEEMRVLLDTPTVRNIYFEADGSVRLYPFGTVGTFDLNGVNQVETEVDFEADRWKLIVNGNVLYDGEFSPSSDDLRAIRFSMGALREVSGSVAAIDNIQVKGLSSSSATTPPPVAGNPDPGVAPPAATTP